MQHGQDMLLVTLLIIHSVAIDIYKVGRFDFLLYSLSCTTPIFECVILTFESSYHRKTKIGHRERIYLQN